MSAGDLELSVDLFDNHLFLETPQVHPQTRIQLLRQWFGSLSRRGLRYRWGIVAERWISL